MATRACRVCGTENEAQARFCIHCGARLAAAACAVCGTVNPPEARFCQQCGNDLTQPGGLVLPAASATPGVAQERRLVSVMFVDLVGFTTASEGRDPEDTRDLLTRYYETAREIVVRYGGTIEKFIGDAVMGVWGAPSAHEDDAERAVRAALELVAAVPPLDPASGLQARAGVLTGEAAVELGLEGQGMIAGDLVNTASRLQSIARPGTVLVGDATHLATSNAIAYEPVGMRELKGKELPVAAWEAVSVVGRRGGEGRSTILEPPFIGRSSELQELKDQLEATIREGRPRLVTIAGIPGIGKSRLLWELEKYLDGVVRGVHWLAGRSPAYGDGLSHRALAEMFRARASVVEADEPDAERDKIAAMLGRFVPDPADRRWIEPRVLGLLGLADPPGDTRDELFAAWRGLLERIAADAPLVLVFSDVQWADEGQLDFIEHLLVWARSSPILVLAEARPELFERRPTWGRNVRTASLIGLEPLEPVEMRKLLAGLVPELPEAAMDRIVARAEGVPLYAVETLRMLIGRGVLEVQGSHYRLTGDLPELSVPETLHALILSRLDDLPADERSLLMDCAILGVSFTLPSLVPVAGLAEEAVTALLERLVRRQILLLEADPRSPERGRYRFVQGVLREVAYASIGKRRRQAGHLAAARYFESLDEDELAGVIATHYMAAYRATPPGEEAEALATQARVALRAAVDRAAGLHDLVGALGTLDQALEITTDVAEQAALHERAIPLAAEAAQFPRAHAHAHAAIAIYQQQADRLGVLRARAYEASAMLFEHQDQPAIALLQQALAEVADLPPSPEVTRAQSELARALMLAGSPDAIGWADRVLQSGVAPRDVLVDAAITKGTALQNAGRHVEAEILLRGGAEVAEASGRAWSQIRAWNNLRVLLQFRDPHAALTLARELLELSRKYGQHTFVIHGHMTSIDISFRLGNWDDYMTEAGMDMVEVSSYYSAWFFLEQQMREIYRGDPAEVEERVDRLLQDGPLRSSEQAMAWAMTVKADAQLAHGDPQAAFATARSAWRHSAENEMAHFAAMFAAACLRDADGIGQARAAFEARITDPLELERAALLAADALAAAAEGRLADARTAFLDAERLLQQLDEQFLLARLRLAFGGLTEDVLPEARAAWDAAAEFFRARGAEGYLERYRAALARAGTAHGGPQREAPAVRRSR